MKTLKKQPFKYLRDIVSLVIWTYILIKIFVFDIDTYFLGLIAPTLIWILNLRLFLLLSLIAILWLILGHKGFLPLFAYILGYPLVILFWKLPIFILRRWATFVILLPSILDAIMSFRATFILHTVILVSAVAVFLSKQPLLLMIAMVCLALSLVFMLYRAFSRSHSTRVYLILANYLQTIQQRTINGEFDFAPNPTSTSTISQASEGNSPNQADSVPQLYVHYVVFDFISQKVEQVDRKNKYNLVLISSLLGVMFWTIIIFSLLHWSLYKLDSAAYFGGTTFFQFLAFSLGRFANTDIIEIHPVSTVAIILTSLQVICSLLILIIGVFSIFTAQRDSFREDFQEFLTAIRKTVELVNERIAFKYSMNSSQLEMSIALESKGIVNLFRRFRGLPDLELPEDNQEASQAPDH